MNEYHEGSETRLPVSFLTRQVWTRAQTENKFAIGPKVPAKSGNAVDVDHHTLSSLLVNFGGDVSITRYSRWLVNTSRFFALKFSLSLRPVRFPYTVLVSVRAIPGLNVASMFNIGSMFVCMIVLYCMFNFALRIVDDFSKARVIHDSNGGGRRYVNGYLNSLGSLNKDR